MRVGVIRRRVANPWGMARDENAKYHTVTPCSVRPLRHPDRKQLSSTQSELWVCGRVPL